MSYVRFAVFAILLLAGVLVLTVSVLGVYRYRFALNRMQTAAMTDTLALMLIMAALLVAMGIRLATLKLVAVVVFMWMASPISSHLLAQLEYRTDPDLEEHAPLCDRTEEAA